MANPRQTRTELGAHHVPVGVVLAAVGFSYWVGAETAWGWFGADALGLVFFPPAGLTLAAAVLMPRRHWPALAVVVMTVETLTNLRHGTSIVPALGFGVANVVEPFVGALAIGWSRRRGWPRRPDLRSQMVRFVLGGAIAGPAVAALIGATVKSADSHHRWVVNALQWTVGDGLGVLCVGGPLLALFSVERSRRPRIAVVALASLIALGTSLLAFWWWDHEPVAYLVLPVLLWAAVRTGAIGIGIPSAIAAVVANVATANGRGPFVDADLSPQMRVAVTQLFLLVSVLAAWTLAVEIDMRLAAERSEHDERAARMRAEGLLSAGRFATRLAAAGDLQQIVQLLGTHLTATVGASQVRLVERQASDDHDGGDPWHGTELRFPVGRRSLGLELLIGWDGSQELSDADRAELQGAVAVAGQALDRAWSYRDAVYTRHAAELAARRLLGLQRVTSLLLAARTTDDVASAVAREAAPALDATTASVLVASDDRWVDLGGEDPGARGHRVPSVQTMTRSRGAHVEDATADPTGEAAGTWVYQPMRLPERGVGALVVGFGPERRVEQGDLELVALLAEQCERSFERARQHELEHEAVERLQRMLLPRSVESTESVEVQACYRPASSALELGGDWYDTILLDGHRMMLVVGDVVGSGLAAALTMGQLRSATRALAGQLRPGRLLDVLDGIAAEVEGGFFTTAAAVLVDPVAGTLEYSVAGHPPPVLRRGGATMLLEEGRSTPLGMGRAPRPSALLPYSPGDLLVLYTDGLVERRTRGIDDGLQALGDVLTRLDWGPGAADTLAHRCLAGANQRDDAAVLLTRLGALVAARHYELQRPPHECPDVASQLLGMLTGLGIDEGEAAEVISAIGQVTSAFLPSPPVSLQRPVDFDVVVDPDGRLVATVKQRRTWSGPDERRPTPLLTTWLDSATVEQRTEMVMLRLQHRLRSFPRHLRLPRGVAVDADLGV